ncbi:MAG: GNAT family N-acetyltransferase [Myxococcales bacterium]|nr:GNAT family N-acetyltransferase [Myxococcales bacterium]
MPTAPVIRRATPSDLPRAAVLAAELVRMHHAVDPGRFLLVDGVEEGYESWFRRELAREHARILVAELDAHIIGYAYGTLEGRDWNLLLDAHGAIHDVFVESSARRTGAGRLLVEALIRELETLGAPRILLSTMVNNTAAQALFAAAGFRPTLLEMTRGGAD